MCGIVGYLGNKEAVTILLDGLQKLEYRGYDSAGIVVGTRENLFTIKAVGKVSRLRERLNKSMPAGKYGIAHTRWATHGEPSEINAHPYFDKNKTKNVLGAACVVKEKFGGKIQRTIEAMLTIPGVGRKTANVVLGNAYGIVEGIAVDTHVKQLAHVPGLTTESTPEKIEQDLMEIFPRKEWFKATYLFIEYGRKYCSARKHEHSACPLTPLLEV